MAVSAASRPKAAMIQQIAPRVQAHAKRSDGKMRGSILKKWQ
jgi:hypothetical protein